VGDRLGIGPALVRFEVFEQHPTAGYAARFVPEQPLPDRLDLSFEGGEWGDLDRVGGLPVPRPFEVLEPDPNAPVLLAGAPFQRIRWTPVGHGSMVLTPAQRGGLVRALARRRRGRR
jgi:hypothetical protein